MNGASTSGMVLATYRSLSHKNPPFASPNIAGLLVTHSEYWHPLLPVIYPRNHHLIYHKFLPQKLPHSKTPKKFKIFQQRRVELSSVKKKGRKKEKEAHCPFQVANYGVQINSNGMPSTPYPQKIPSSMRLGFG